NGVTSEAPPVTGLALQVKDLRVSYGPKRAVDGVSLDINEGEIFGLLGPNGAGKTSTLSAIEGLLKPTSGSILIRQVDVRANTSGPHEKDHEPTSGHDPQAKTQH